MTNLGTVRRRWLPRAALFLAISFAGLMVASSALAGSGIISSAPSGGSGVSTAVTLPPGSDFTTYLGNEERTSNISGEVLLNESTVSKLQQLWQYETKGAPAGDGGVQSQAIELGGTVYFGAQDGYEYAVNAATGASIWSTFLGQDKNDTGCAGYYGIVGVVSTATIVGTTLYVGGGDSHFYSLNATTGKVNWRIVVGGSDTAGFFQWTSPLIYGGDAYVGVSAECGAPHVGAGVDQISLSSHTLVNYFNTSINQKNGSSVWGSISVNPATNTLFVPTGNPGQDPTASKYSESILELNATDLQLKEQFQVPANQSIIDGDFGATPTVFTPAGGQPMVTAMDKNGILYALTQSNLKPIWEYKVTTGIGRISTSFGGGLLYAMSQKTTIGGTNYTGSIRAFNPLNGKVVWQDGFTQEPYNTYGAPVFVNGVVIVGDNNILDFINSATGTILKTVTYSTTIEPPVSVARGEVFVGDMNGNLTAYYVPSTSPTQYSVSGTVHNSTGAALSGATVGYVLDSTPESVSTNTAGQYSFSVPDGTYSVTASATGYTSESLNVKVNGTSISGVNFVLTASSSTGPDFKVTGRAVYSNDSPVYGATASVPSGGKTLTSITDSGGYWSISVPDGAYTFSVSLTGYITATAQVTVNGAAVYCGHNVLVRGASKTYSVTGGVENASSKAAISGATISTTVAGSPVNATSNSAGNFTLSLPNGTYSLLAAASGYQSSTFSVTVHGAAIFAGTFRLTPPKSSSTTTYKLTVRVLTTAGVAIAGATVDYSGGGHSGQLGQVTSSSGYTSGNLLNGSYTITVTTSGYTTQSVPVTINGAALAVDVRMTAS
jgi:outer membrane protein assembly factor BamB